LTLAGVRERAHDIRAPQRSTGDVKEHLLSHGRTRGVQGQHYERYDFLDEKRRALRKWAAHLERIIEGKPQSKVAAIRAA